MCIEMLQVFQRIATIHETHTYGFLYFFNYLIFLLWEKKKFMAPFLWMGFNYIEATEQLRGDS